MTTKTYERLSAVEVDLEGTVGIEVGSLASEEAVRQHKDAKVGTGRTRRLVHWLRTEIPEQTKFPIRLLLATNQLHPAKRRGPKLTLVRTTRTLFLEIAISLSLLATTFPISLWNLVPLPKPFRISFNFLIKA